MKPIYTRAEILAIRKKLKEEKKKVVFTNGCFDVLHAGHVDYLNKAKTAGDVLILGLNSDASVKRIKGAKRPIVNEEERAFILSNLKAVDYVTLFEEDTPQEIIGDLIPDILIKGADWAIDKIVGRDIVEANGGEVKTISFVTDQSTTNIIQTIIERYGK
ncbi:MAG: D-glycero-beta-D-manno-heptose 1-phosphate adenylyltransferase [Ignavibacteria bacterium]|nr:D-glycero-beta-D-manno-heptose 1-phosphate adenylyltransferase [Ignavibacteria bacterium]